MPGFVWRLKDGVGDGAMALHWPGDPAMNINMCVRETAKALGTFVLTVHRNIYVRKHKFFETPTQPMLALWWVEAIYTPTLEDASERLDHYRSFEPSDYAIDWKDLPESKVWSERRCA